MSATHIVPFDHIISSSQISTPEPYDIQIPSPSSFPLYLQTKFPNNPALIQEILSLFELIFPYYSQTDPPHKNSIDAMINELDMESSPKKSQVFIEKPEFSDFANIKPQDGNKGLNKREFSVKEMAGFLLMCFGLFIDMQEMVSFISKECPDFLGDFLESCRDLPFSNNNKSIYQGLVEFYKQYNEYFYGKMLMFMRKKPELNILKVYFIKEIPYTSKVSQELLDILLQNYEEFDLFLRYNARRIPNDSEIYDRIFQEVLKIESPRRKTKIKDERLLVKLSIKCFENKWNSLFKLILKYKPILLDNMSLFHQALAHKNMVYVRKFLKVNENSRQFLLDEDNFGKLLDFFEKEENFLDGIFLLNQIKSKDFNIFYQRVIIEKFFTFLSTTAKSPISLYGILISNINPFGLSVLLSHIFLEMSHKSQELHLKFQYLAMHFRDLANAILEKLQNSIKIKPLITKTFYPAEIPVLSILLKAKDFFEIILINPNIYEIINCMWNSSYEESLNFFNLSTNYCLLSGRMPILMEGDFNNTSNNIALDKSIMNMSSSPTKPKESNSHIKSLINFTTGENLNESKANLFKCIKTVESMNEKKNYLLQFKIYSKCMGFRYSLEFLCFFTAFGMILTILIDNLTLIFDLNKVSDDLVYALFHFMLDYKSNTNNQVVWVNSLAGLFPAYQKGSFLNLFSSENQKNDDFICQSALYVHNKNMSYIDSDMEDCLTIYQKLNNYNNEKTSSLIKECFLTLTCISSILQIVFYIFKNKYIKMTFGHLIDIIIFLFTLALMYYTVRPDTNYLIENFKELLQNMKIILTGLILLIFVKFLNFSRISNWFGIPLRIIFKMMASLSSMIILFLIMFLSFSVFMYFLFTSKDEHYTTLFISIKSLFKFVFGEMIYYYGPSKTTDYSYFGFLSAGLIFIRIIFLNILISILSNIYESIQKRSGLEISLMIHDYASFQNSDDKTLSSLVILPAPFNIISFIFAPFILIKRSQKLNNFVLRVGVFFILLFLSQIFLLAHILIIPITWLKVLWSLIINDYGEEYETHSFSFWIRTTHILEWLTLGQFFQLYILFKYDLPSFFRKAFASVYVSSKMDEFSIREYEVLKKLVRIYQVNFVEKTVDIEIFRKKFLRMYELLNIYEEIRGNSNEKLKKNEEILMVMKNNFENLIIRKEIRLEVLEKLLKHIKLLKKRKENGTVVKYPYFIDLLNLQQIGDTIKLYQYKNQLLK